MEHPSTPTSSSGHEWPGQTLLTDYTSSIEDTTVAKQRLEASRLFVDNLTIALSGDHSEAHVSKDQCKATISQLVRVSLVTNHSTPELQKFLLSQEVVTLVHTLVYAMDHMADGGIVLDGLLDGVGRSSKIGWKGLINHGIQIISHWFLKQGSYLPTREGFIRSAFRFVRDCSEQQKSVVGNRLYDESTMDAVLSKLVRISLRNETATSINAREDGRGLTLLHSSTGVLLLPLTTRELLQYPDIDVNVQCSLGYTPVLLVVNQLQNIDDRHGRVFDELLDCSKVDVKITDSEGENAMDHLFEQLEKKDPMESIILTMIKGIHSHPTTTLDLDKSGFSQLLTLMRKKVSTDAVTNLHIENFGWVMDLVKNGAILAFQEQLRSLLEYCSRRLRSHSGRGQAYVLCSLLTTILSHTPEDIQPMVQIVEAAFVHSFPAESQESHGRYLLMEKVISSERFNINTRITELQTIAHLAARACDVKLTAKILQQPGFDPNIADSMGNTVLYYICEHLPATDAIGFIEDSNINWRFDITNKASQTASVYYSKTADTNPVLQQMLTDRCGNTNSAGS